jgi:hypothetical protein
VAKNCCKKACRAAIDLGARVCIDGLAQVNDPVIAP